MNNTYLLFKQKRFLPLFLTQFQGALTDNLIKNALILMATYEVYASAPDTAGTIIAVSGALLMLPFFFFSSISGQLADKYDKAVIARIIKGFEICVMLLAVYGFMQRNIFILLSVVFLLGLHSTFFGPIKYSILPQHLEEKELLAGNAFIEGGTFIAILIGCILGNEMPSLFNLGSLSAGAVYVAGFGTVLSSIGFIISFFIPTAPSFHPDIKIDKNVFKSTMDIIKYSKANQRVFSSIMGVSWFWLIGMTILTLLPNFAKTTLNAEPSVYTLFLVVFTVGMAAGSIICERILKAYLDTRYVPFGALGMTIFIIVLFALTTTYQSTGEPLSLLAFLSSIYNWLIILDTWLIALFAGFFVVPLNTNIQYLSDKSHMSRVIAANNIFNSLFMVAGAVFYTVCLKFLGLPIPVIILILGLLNLLVTVYIVKTIPGSLLKVNLEWILKLLYKVKVTGYENFAQAGERVLVIANHTSFIDGLLLAVFLPGKFIFAVNTQFAKKWYIKMLDSLIDFLPIDPVKPMAAVTIIKEIRKGKKCIIFPEGRLTMTGALMKIYEGPSTIAEKSNARILPVRIDGALYTPFTRAKGKVATKWFPQITITILPHREFNIDPGLTSRERRRLASMKLYSFMTEMMFDSSCYKEKIFSSLLKAQKVFGKKHKIIEDLERTQFSYINIVRKSFILGDHLSHTYKNETRYGILMPNAVSTLVVFLSMHTHGKVPVLINFSTGVANVLHSISISGIKHIFTSRRFIESAKLGDLIQEIQKTGYDVVFLENVKSSISIRNIFLGWIYSCFPKISFRMLSRPATADDPAVVLFTSGSEGKPKGVALSHTNLQANRYQVSSKVDFTSSDTIFNALPLFHSFGLTCGTILPFLSGVKVFLYPSPLHYKIVPELAYDTNSTIMFGTDTFLMNYGKAAHPYDFYSVRYVFAGAEKLKKETIETWNNKFGIRIFEGYGATETSPILATNTPMECKIGSVGKLLPRVESKLEHFEGVEDGGRLFVRGPNIMSGYILSPENPQVIPLEDGWYDTGDIVRFDSEGYAYIIGRAKRFAKIAGEMVSLTQVESEISKLSQGYLHAVASIPDPSKGEQLILVTESSVTRKEILEHFKSKGLSEIMIPKKIINVKTMPLLGTGKIDYQTIKKMTYEML